MDQFIYLKQKIKELEDQPELAPGYVIYTREFNINDYTLRVTGKTKEEILKSLKDMVHNYTDGVELYVVGFEDNHCHIVMEPWGKGKSFRDDIKTLFNIEKATDYSLTKIRDSPIKALSYVLKDGDYNVGCHVCPKQLETAGKLCFGKGTLSFKKAHEKLLESFAKTNNRKDYFKRYIELKIHHNQRIYWHHINAHCTTTFMKMDKYYRNSLINDKWVNSGLMSHEEQDDYYHNN